MPVSGALFLLDLQTVNSSLDVAPAINVELVPSRLALRVDLRGRLGDQDQPIRMTLDDSLGDYRLSRARPAGQDDSFHDAESLAW
jgi:hypothetical protein